MKLVTYNIHKAGRTDATANAIAAALADLDADIIALQEVYVAHSSVRSHARVIADYLGMEVAFETNARAPGGRHGNATFCRYPMKTVTNLDLTRSRLERRGGLHTTVPDLSGLHIINVHLSLTARQRRRQWTAIKEHMPDDPPMLLVGDFNDWRGRLDGRITATTELRSAHRMLTRAQARTFPARAPRLNLDRIYGRGLTFTNVGVLRGRPWDRLSDHLPLYAEFSVARRPP